MSVFVELFLELLWIGWDPQIEPFECFWEYLELIFTLRMPLLLPIHVRAQKQNVEEIVVIIDS